MKCNTTAQRTTRRPARIAIGNFACRVTTRAGGVVLVEEVARDYEGLALAAPKEYQCIAKFQLGPENWEVTDREPRFVGETDRNAGIDGLGSSTADPHYPTSHDIYYPSKPGGRNRSRKTPLRAAPATCRVHRFRNMRAEGGRDVSRDDGLRGRRRRNRPDGPPDQHRRQDAQVIGRPSTRGMPAPAQRRPAAASASGEPAQVRTSSTPAACGRSRRGSSLGLRACEGGVWSSEC